MNLASGVRLGPYTIVSRLGAGGMGEVFKALDTRLGRNVAIKVLPREFAEDASVRLRLEREAQAVSRINHPNICTLHDIGQDNGMIYLVMELLEGENLGERLDRGPLPIADVLRYGSQIAEALASAHAAAIVHRDLKPGNIMLTKSGAKLLDFGLAKASTIDINVEGATVQKALTAEGTMIGTFQYMAPEQLEGQDAGARTDIFALGSVLYEMTTGRRAFEGKTKTSLIAAITSGQPAPIATLQPVTPPGLEHVIATCLAKDPDDRWQSARDVARELRWIAETERSAAPPRRPVRAVLPWVVGALLLSISALVILLRPWTSTLPARPMRFTIDPPPGTVFHFIGRDAGPPAIAPDGSRVAFAAVGDGIRRIYVRTLDAVQSSAVAGTEGGSYPFWSADSRNLAFFADGKLKRVSASGGAVMTLSDAPVGRGGTWNANGTIVFAPDPYDSLFRVADSGGSRSRVTVLAAASGEASHRWPSFLPDRSHFLFLANHLLDREGNQVFVGSLEGGATPLIRTRSQVMYTPGFLLTVHDKNLMAMPFDAKRLRMTGAAFPIATDVQTYANTGSGIFSVADDGTFVYQPASNTAISRFVWYDRQGKVLGDVGRAGNLEDPRLSLDQRYVASADIDPESGSQNIWICDLTSSTATRFTYQPTFDHFPVWSPDGRLLAFDSSRSGRLAIYVKPVGGEERLLYEAKGSSQPTDFSPDGSRLVFQTLSADTKWDLWTLKLQDRSAQPLIRGAANEKNGQISPDGRWMLFTSDESGRYEVYATRFPDATGRWQISSTGGTQPRWRGDGREVFYLSPDRKLMAVPVRGDEHDFVVGSAQVLFETRARLSGERSFDVASDGRKFLINTPTDLPSPPIVVVVNYPGISTAARK